MLKVKKLFLLCAILSIIFSSFSFVTFADLPSFNAEKDFQNKQGTIWKYQGGYNNNGYYTFDDYSNVDGKWGNINVGVIERTDDDMVTGQSAIYMHSGATSDPTLTFIAPYSGIIEISMANGGVYCPLNGKDQEFDGINFYMCCGSTLVAAFEGVNSNNSKKDNKVFEETYTVEIVKGERIYFIVQPNKNTANDKVTFNPLIRYIKVTNTPEMKATIPAYIGNRSTVSPSGKQDFNFISNITGTVKDGVYKISEEFGNEMKNWEFFWENSNIRYKMTYHDGTYYYDKASYGTIAQKGTRWHPHIAGSNVLVFTCPESGRIRVGSECTMEVRKDTVDGVNIKLISERNILGDTYLLDSEIPNQEFKPIEFDVYKGQKLNFYLDMNIGNAGDSTTFAPYVKYLEYKEVAKYDVGKYQEYIAPKDDGTLRNDIVPELNNNEIDLYEIALGAAIAVLTVLVVIGCWLLIVRRRNYEKH